MDVKYKYGRRPGRRRRTRIFIVLLISVAIVGGVGSLVYADIQRGKNDKAVTGPSHTIVQSIDASQDTKRIDEATFTMELPGDWKELSRQTTATENSITWQATKKGEDNRKLTLYVDVIPATLPINRLLPVNAVGNGIDFGNASDNCLSFTQKPADNAAVNDVNNLAKYDKIDFHCDFSQIILNKVGTGSTDGINMLNVTGPTKGKHKYFFVFNDQNIQPNLTILTNALKSFKAK